MKRIYRLIKDTNIRIVTHKKKINIFWFPMIETDSDLQRELARIVWYINPIIDKVDKIVLVVSDKYLQLDILKLNLPEYVDTNIKYLLPNFQNKILFFNNPLDIQSIQYDLVIEWFNQDNQKRKKALYPYYINASVIQNQFEANQIMKISNVFLDKSQKKENYTKLMNFFNSMKRKEYKSAYLFGSGPSLNDFNVESFEAYQSFSIVCNSVVKNLDLMKQINPKVIVATDAVFHSGYSKYAQEFRHSLIKAMDLFNELYFLVPLRDYNLYLHNLPNRFSSRIIGIHGKKIKKFNIDLSKKQYLKSTSNVLTFFLLPLAASLSHKIKIVGFDGKSPEDQNIFWKYDKNSQFLETIDYTKIAHPAFYKVDYAHYYQIHCMEVQQIIDYLKKKKIDIENLGISYIPALKALTK